MSVIASLIGAGGLGGQVITALSTFDMALGIESGIAVVLAAIILGRPTGAVFKRALHHERSIRVNG